MEMSGSRVIRADRMAVWAALNDAEVLRQAVPGCTEMSGSAEDGFEAVVTQKIGPVKATFRGAVSLSDVVAGESYRISGEGKGGAAGFAKGGADVRLSDAEDGTLLEYDVQANVGGKLAQLGSRLIDGVARKLADQFFENFDRIVTGEADPAESVDAEETVPADGDEAPKKGWFSKLRG